MSDGSALEAITEFVSSNEIPAIPHGTELQAIIESVKWEEPSDFYPDAYINVKFSALKPSDFENRKVGIKLHVNNAKKADRAKKFFAAIDNNCGSKHLTKQIEPTDETLEQYWLNKVMSVRVAVFTTEGKFNDDGTVAEAPKEINYVDAVSAKKKAAPTAKAEVPKPKAKPAVDPEIAAMEAKLAAAKAAAAYESFDDDIPY